MTVLASGYRYENDLVCTFRLRDGLIVHFDERLDAVPLVAAMGGP
jgi:hypothetical protein